MLRGIDIRNFRGAKSCKIDGFNQINLFIGKFGSGKSTILDAVYLIKILTDTVNPFRKILQRRTRRGVDLKNLWNKYDSSEKVKVTWVFEDKSIKIEVGEAKQMEENRGEIGLRALRIVNGSIEKSVSNYTNWNLNVHSGFPEFVDEFISNIILIDDEFVDKVSDTEALYLKPLKVKVLDKRFIDELNEIYQNVIDFEFLPLPRITSEFRASFEFEDFRVFMDDLADGIRSGIALLLTIFMHKNTAILLEEPENHQYPRALTQLIAKLVEITKRNNLQLFITTHRPEVLSHFAKFGREMVKIFHVTRENGNIIAVPIEWNDIKILLDVGWDVGELIKGFEKFVIVDGETDKLVIEESIRKIKNADPGELLISLVNSRGQIKEIVKAFLSTEKEILILPDINEKGYEISKNAIISSIKSLESEGYKFEQENDKIKLNKGNLEYEIRKSNIIPLGNPERFQNFKKHAIDDYVLETLLINENLQEKYNIKETIIEVIKKN